MNEHNLSLNRSSECCIILATSHFFFNFTVFSVSYLRLTTSKRLTFRLVLNTYGCEPTTISRSVSWT
jgi:hypothetical protein